MTDSAHEAEKYAFKLLGYRSRSEKELKERLLKKGFSEKVVAVTLAVLRDKGYINDSDFASDMLRQAIEKRLLGFEGARFFLMNRGVPPDLAKSVAVFDEETELRNAGRLLEKKLSVLGRSPEKKDKRRLRDFLLRRGYKMETVKKVMNNFNSDEEEQ